MKLGRAAGPLMRVFLRFLASGAGLWISLSFVRSSAQGLLSFRVFAEVRIAEGFQRVGGSNYLAELLAAPAIPSDAPFVPVGLPTPLRAAGDVNGGLRIVTNVLPGENARVMVRVWDSQGGTILNYRLASLRGQSEIAVLRLAFPDGPRQSEFPPPSPFALSSIRLAYHPAPDPCDCEFSTLFADSVGIGFKDSFEMLALSGNGMGILLRTDGYRQSPGGYYFRYGFGILNDGPGGIQLLASSEDFNPFEPGVPPSTQPRWTAATLTTDGRTSIGTHLTLPEPQSQLLLSGNTPPVAVPLALAAGISGDGQFAVGKTKSLDWVRIDLRNTHLPPEKMIGQAASADLRRLIGISRDGGVITWDTGIPDQPLGRWTPTQGFRFVGPKGLVPRLVSSDGNTVVGKFKTNGLDRAAWWSEQRGLVLLGPTDRRSVATGVSADGTVQTGFVEDGMANQIVVWRDGAAGLSLSNLVRGVDLRPLADIRYDLASDAAFLSDDARTLVFSGTAISSSDLHRGFRARISFPGESPQLSIQQSGTDHSLRWTGKSGYLYQILASQNLQDWLPWKMAVNGSNAPVVLPVKSGDQNESYFKLNFKLQE